MKFKYRLKNSSAFELYVIIEIYKKKISHLHKDSDNNLKKDINNMLMLQKNGFLDIVKPLVEL